MKSLLHLFLVMMTTTLIANPSTKVDFINGSLSLAIQKAGQEGKLLFVEFGAKWCMPCRFMEENTFKDHSVVSYMANNYVPVKIDIDDFDGYAYKQKYKVEALPTFLIFNSEGKVIDRYEQSMAPSNLLNVLKQHNQDRNRRLVATPLSAFEIEAQLHEEQRARVNVSPYQASEIENVEEAEAIDPVETTDQPALHNQTKTEPIIEDRFDDTPIIEEVVQNEPVIEEDQSTKENVAVEISGELLWEDEEVYEMEEPTIKETEEVATQEIAAQIENSSPSIVFYTVRVGNFANEQSMNDYVKATSAIFVEDTHIFEEVQSGIPSFEVCLGAFATEKSANQFIEKLGLLNIQGEVKSVEQ